MRPVIRSAFLALTLLLAGAPLGAARAGQARRGSSGPAVRPYAGPDVRSRKLFGKGKFRLKIGINVYPEYRTEEKPGDRPVASIARALFSRTLKPAEWAGLVGAPDGAELTISDFDAYKRRGSELKDHRLQIATSHHLYAASQLRGVGLDRGGNLYIHNDSFRLDPKAPVGTGTRILARQIQVASQLGVKYVKVSHALRRDDESPKMNGYYTWPRLGFNGSIPRAVRARAGFTRRFGKVKDLHDLFSREGGAAWWKAHGISVDSLRLDLTPGSKTLKAHEAYLAEKGIAM